MFAACSADPFTAEVRGADVYIVDKDEQWNATNNVLEPMSTEKSEYTPHTLSIEVQDTAGVLNQVCRRERVGVWVRL